MKKYALMLAIGGIILGGILGYQAISSEITGKTFAYSFHGDGHRGKGAFITMSRESSPIEFRQANNFFWGISGFCIFAAVVGVIFYRGLDDCN
jgi:hypothetical protein